MKLRLKSYICLHHEEYVPQTDHNYHAYDLFVNDVFVATATIFKRPNDFFDPRDRVVEREQCFTPSCHFLVTCLECPIQKNYLV